MYAIICTFNSGEFLKWSIQSIRGVVDRLIIADGSYLDSPMIGLSNDDTETIVEQIRPWFKEVIFVRGVFINQSLKRSYLISLVPKGEYYLVWDDDQILVQEPIIGEDKAYRSVFRHEVGVHIQTNIIRRGNERYDRTHWFFKDEEGETLLFNPKYKLSGLICLHFKFQRSSVRKAYRILDHIVRYERRYLVCLGGKEEDYWKLGFVPYNWELSYDYRYVPAKLLEYHYHRYYHEELGTINKDAHLNPLLINKVLYFLGTLFHWFEPEMMDKFVSEEPRRIKNDRGT